MDWQQFNNIVPLVYASILFFVQFFLMRMQYRKETKVIDIVFFVSILTSIQLIDYIKQNNNLTLEIIKVYIDKIIYTYQLSINPTETEEVTQKVLRKLLYDFSKRAKEDDQNKIISQLKKIETEYSKNKISKTRNNRSSHKNLLISVTLAFVLTGILYLINIIKGLSNILITYKQVYPYSLLINFLPYIVLSIIFLMITYILFKQKY